MVVMIRGKKFKRAIIVCAALVTLNPVLGDEFQNSVVNIKFDKDANNNVSINLVTSKPYARPLFINKKQDNHYVILLPETKNCMCGQPIIDNLAGLVSGVTIKTQPYIEGGAKGYTKITISAPQSINLRAVTSVSVQGATIASKAIPQAQQKQVRQPTQQSTNTVVAHSQKSGHKHLASQQQIKIVVKDTDSVKQPTNSLVAEQPKTTIKSDITKKSVKSKVKPNIEAPVAKPSTEIKLSKKTIDSIENPTFPQPEILIKEKKNLENEIKNENVLAQSKVDNSTDEVTFMDVVLEKTGKLANLIKLHTDLLKLLLVISAVGFPLLVIFYIVILNRRIKEQIEETKIRSEEIIQTEPSTSEPEQVVLPVYDDMEQQSIENKSEETSFADYMNDSVISEEEKEEVLVDEVEEPTEEFVTEEVEEPQDEVEEVFVDEVEEPTEEFVPEEVEQPQDEVEEVFVDEVEEPTEEFVTEEVEEPQDEVEEVFVEEVKEPTEELVPEEVEEPQDEVEEVFVDEVEEPTEEFVPEDVELPQDEGEEAFVDEVEETTEEFVTEEVEESQDEGEEAFVDEVEEIAEILETEEQSEFIETGSFDVYEPDGFIDDFEIESDDDSIFDELIESSSNTQESDILSQDSELESTDVSDDEFEELIHEHETTEEGLIVLDRTSIDEQSGFYLVNFENFTSLIGYINDEIFVLKTFDTFVNNHIYIKVAEKLSGHIVRYIVKIGIYKMVIEVTPDKMSHLIDL